MISTPLLLVESALLPSTGMLSTVTVGPTMAYMDESTLQKGDSCDIEIL